MSFWVDSVSDGFVLKPFSFFPVCLGKSKWEELSLVEKNSRVVEFKDLFMAGDNGMFLHLAFGLGLGFLLDKFNCVIYMEAC